MAAQTFDEVCRKVQLRVPSASPLLVEDFVQQGYEEICGRRRWSFLRGEGRIIVGDARGGTVDVTHNSATVTGVGLTFVAGDKNRQFRIGGTGVPYTIAEVDTGANTATLDNVYGAATATAATAQILDAYVRTPDDFGSWWLVVDPARADFIDFWNTEEEIGVYDPQRTNSGNPRALVSRRLATVADFEGRIEYELWPYQTSQSEYPFLYGRQPERLVLTKAFRGPFRYQNSAVITAALKHAALWPGPDVDRRNPYFNLGLAQRLTAQLDEQLAGLERQDEEIFMTWLETIPWARRYPIRGGRDFRAHE